VIGFRPTPHPTLRQGDILLAPVANLAPGVEPAKLAAPPRMVGERVFGGLWAAPGAGSIPPVAVLATWVPVLILSHDCELEKEFNERVIDLLAQGVGEAEAIDIASADPDLDPWAAVAPLLPLETFEARRHSGILQGQRIGVFPVPSLPHEAGAFAVNLFRVSTVSTELLWSSPKLASLDEASVHVLRFKLSEAYASRDLSTLEELNQAVGARVTGVEALPAGKKKTSLVLHLEGRESLHLDIRTPREAGGPGVLRNRRS